MQVQSTQSKPLQFARYSQPNRPPPPQRSGLAERSDFNNLPPAPTPAKPQAPIEVAKSGENRTLERNRSGVLGVPTKKIWESDWTLLIP